MKLSENRALISILLALVWVTMTLVGLTACKPKETELPFETLVHDNLGYFGATYESMDLMVATDVTEAQQIADTLSPENPGKRFEEIADIDYEEYLVIVAYFGTRVYSKTAITIEKVTQIEDVVDVIISTVEPMAGDRIIVHPIHIIKVKKDDLLVRGPLVFRLWKESEIILTREHVVP
ncbi:MAG: hypothetical protein ACLFTI_01735 [Anaerolineales bacterium]